MIESNFQQHNISKRGPPGALNRGPNAGVTSYNRAFFVSLMTEHNECDRPFCTQEILTECSQCVDMGAEAVQNCGHTKWCQNNGWMGPEYNECDRIFCTQEVLTECSQCEAMGPEAVEACGHTKWCKKNGWMEGGDTILYVSYHSIYYILYVMYNMFYLIYIYNIILYII